MRQKCMSESTTLVKICTCGKIAYETFIIDTFSFSTRRLGLSPFIQTLDLLNPKSTSLGECSV